MNLSIDELNKLKKEYDTLVKEYDEIIVTKFDSKDFEEYNTVLFSAHSCGIEGNSFTVNETRELREKKLLLKLQNKSLYEAYEILEHFKAYEFLNQRINEPLTEELLKETHKILTKTTLPFRIPEAIPGEYTTMDMGAGSTIFGDHKKNISRVSELLEKTNEAIKKSEIHPMEISAYFHKYFIYLHPFRDGNGRMGRLFSNFILRKYELPNVIIERTKKEDYINSLKASEKHKTLLPITAFFFETSIERMKNEMAQKNGGDKFLFEVK